LLHSRLQQPEPLHSHVPETFWIRALHDKTVKVGAVGRGEAHVNPRRMPSDHFGNKMRTTLGIEEHKGNVR
jgi:hypothetical protein